MTQDSPFALPQLSHVFDALRRGRHLCPEDGKPYWALRDHLDAFQDLFHHLGFRLEYHPRDFFYFRGRDSLSPQASRMAVFVFVLIESLSDQGEPVVESLMTQTFSVPDLPHFKGARYRAYLKEAGAAGEDDLRGIIRQLDRFGFAQRLSDDTFRFRAPAYRFFDVCAELLKQHDATPQQESAP